MSLPGLEALSKVEEATGHLTLSTDPQIDLNITPRQGTPAQSLAQELQATLAGMGTLLFLVPGDLGGAKQALRSATVEARGELVHVKAKWPYQAIEQAIEQLAELARTGKRPDPARSSPSWLPW